MPRSRCTNISLCVDESPINQFLPVATKERENTNFESKLELEKNLADTE